MSMIFYYIINLSNSRDRPLGPFLLVLIPWWAYFTLFAKDPEDLGLSKIKRKSLFHEKGACIFTQSKEGLYFLVCIAVQV